MEDDFRSRGGSVVGTKSKPSLKQQNRRQRARNQQEVVEVIVKEMVMDMRLKHPTIECIERARHKKKSVAQILETFQSKAMMRNPIATASTNFKSRIMP
jgi:hypothetical protein